MIVFDDYKFIEYISKNRLDGKRGRDAALRSAARVFETYKDYKEFAGCRVSDAYAGFTDSEFTYAMDFYHDRHSGQKPIVPHPVYFSCDEIAKIRAKGIYGNIHSMRTNFILIFLFKYFNTNNIKVSLAEIRKLIDRSQPDSWSEVELLKCIRMTRSEGTRRVRAANFRLKRQSHKPAESTKGFTYCGDVFCDVKKSFESNINEAMWDILF